MRPASPPICIALLLIVLTLTAGFGMGGFQQLDNYPWSSPAFSPDGNTLALVGGDRVYVYDCTGLEAGLKQRQVLVGHRDAILDVTFSPDGQRLASGGTDHVAIIWDLSSGTPIVKHRFNGFVQAVRFSPDGTMFATGSSDGSIALYESSGKTVRTQVLPKVQDEVFDLAFHPNSKRLAVAARRQGVLVWEVNESRWSEPPHPEEKDGDVRSVAYSPSGDLIAAVDHNGFVRIWDSSNFELKTTLRHERGDKVWFHSDGFLIVTVGANRVKLWRLADGEQMHDVYGRFACFSPDRKRLLLVRYGGYSWLDL